MRFEIKLNPLYKKVPELKKNPDKKEFFKFLTHVYYKYIIEAVDKQIFAERFVPLSKAWLARKEKRGWDLGFWIATGFLEKAITYKYNESTNKYWVFIDGRIRHPETNTHLQVIVKANEFGTDNIPARPMFRWSFQRVLDDLEDIYTVWQTGFDAKKVTNTIDVLSAVKGIGPRTLSKLIFGIGIDQVLDAVNEQNEKILIQAPGIGHKRASKIIFNLSENLKDRLRRGER